MMSRVTQICNVIEMLGRSIDNIGVTDEEYREISESVGLLLATAYKQLHRRFVIKAEDER